MTIVMNAQILMRIQDLELNHDVQHNDKSVSTHKNGQKALKIKRQEIYKLKVKYPIFYSLKSHLESKQNLSHS